MANIRRFEYRHTSVSLRKSSARRLKAAVLVFRRNGVAWSESEVLRQLAKLYLKCWRGRGKLTAGGRRYNESIAGTQYCQRPWYVEKYFARILWQRALHSGESVSRMLDFAIRHYMPVLIENVLRNPYRQEGRAQQNYAFWASRYSSRRRKHQVIFINYKAETRENSPEALEYIQRYAIFHRLDDIPDQMQFTQSHAA